MANFVKSLRLREDLDDGLIVSGQSFALVFPTRNAIERKLLEQFAKFASINTGVSVRMSVVEADEFDTDGNAIRPTAWLVESLEPSAMDYIIERINEYTLKPFVYDCSLTRYHLPGAVRVSSVGQGGGEKVSAKKQFRHSTHNLRLEALRAEYKAGSANGKWKVIVRVGGEVVFTGESSSFVDAQKSAETLKASFEDAEIQLVNPLGDIVQRDKQNIATKIQLHSEAREMIRDEQLAALERRKRRQAGLPDYPEL